MPITTETTLVLLSVDLAGYTRCVAELDTLGVAQFIDDWYRCCTGAIRDRGGRVVKFMGDGCFAVFDDDKGTEAIEAARAIAAALPAVRDRHGLTVELGANVHVASVAAGDFGPDDDRRFDVIGAGVNDLFRMGGGAGIRISEPIYDQLPGEARGAWAKARGGYFAGASHST